MSVLKLLLVIKYHEYLVIVLTSDVPVLRRELTEIKVALRPQPTQAN